MVYFRYHIQFASSTILSFRGAMFPLFESLRQKTNTSNDTSHLQHGFAISWFDKLRRSPNCVDDVAYLQLGDIEEGKEIDESSERDTSLDEESLKPSRTHPVVKRMVGWLHLFLPSFLQNSSSESKKLHPTAWLGSQFLSSDHRHNNS